LEAVAMSYSQSFRSGHQEQVDHLLAPVAVLTTCVALGLDALGVWGDGTPGAEPQTSQFLAVAGITVMSAVVVFGLLLPQLIQLREAGGVALTLGLLALVTVPVFWLGVSGVLGVAAVLLGIRHRHDERRGSHAKAGATIGALAAVAYVLMYLADWANTNSLW
jgi:CBS domain containing-hemolysin-like protein